MIERYTLPEMGNIWTETAKLKTWLQVEIAVCEAQAELGYIPAAAVEEIKLRLILTPNESSKLKPKSATT